MWMMRTIVDAIHIRSFNFTVPDPNVSFKTSQAKKSEYGECAKFVNFIPADKKGKKTDGKVKVTMNDDAIENARKLAGYNMLLTSELKMSDQEIYKAYHNLWRIEESFRIMKSELDARPVYLQKEETITGHFLICYLAVLLTRLLQFKALENKFCPEEIFAFIRDLYVLNHRYLIYLTTFLR